MFNYFVLCCGNGDVSKVRQVIFARQIDILESKYYRVTKQQNLLKHIYDNQPTKECVSNIMHIPYDTWW